MTKEEKKLLSTFETRLRHLLYLHGELRRENKQLKEFIAVQKEENARILEECEKLKADYTNLKTASAISLNGSDVKDAKLRLSKLVRDVDKCIALLNE